MIICKNKIVIAMIAFFVFNMYSETSSSEIIDPEYLKSAKYLKIDSFDTLDSYKGSKPQMYYIDLFTSLLIMGINGYTNYEVLDDDSKISPDLILKCKLLEMSSDSQKTNKAVNVYQDQEGNSLEAGYYTTYCTIQITGYNPESNKMAFKSKKKKGTSYKKLEDELKECVIKIAEDFLKFLYKIRKEPFKKSYYVNSLKCDVLADKKVSYIFLGEREDPFLDKILDVVEAELQQYCYEKKIMIFKLDKKPDSIIQSNIDGINLDVNNNVLSSDMHLQLQESQVEFLLAVSDLTGFKKEKLPDKMKKWSRSNFAWRSTSWKTVSWSGGKVSVPGGSFTMGGPSDDPGANMREMNKYQRIFCTLNMIDIKTNQLILQKQLFLMEDIRCDNPAVCLTRRIIAEIGEYDSSTHSVFSCYGSKKKARKKRRKR